MFDEDTGPTGANSISSKLQPRDQTNDVKHLESQMLHARLDVMTDAERGKYIDDPAHHGDMNDAEIDDPRFPYQEWYKVALKAKN